MDGDAAVHHPPRGEPAGYPFTRSEVRAKVDNLTAALTEKALTEYRRGRFQAAIADWQTILSYDPGHEEAVTVAPDRHETARDAEEDAARK